MMMTGRVLLVCALCVLWCGAGGGDAFFHDDATRKKYFGEGGPYRELLPGLFSSSGSATVAEPSARTTPHVEGGATGILPKPPEISPPSSSAEEKKTEKPEKPELGVATTASLSQNDGAATQPDVNHSTSKESPPESHPSSALPSDSGPAISRSGEATAEDLRSEEGQSLGSTAQEESGDNGKETAPTTPLSSPAAPAAPSTPIPPVQGGAAVGPDDILLVKTDVQAHLPKVSEEAEEMEKRKGEGCSGDPPAADGCTDPNTASPPSTLGGGEKNEHREDGAPDPRLNPEGTQLPEKGPALSATGEGKEGPEAEASVPAAAQEPSTTTGPIKNPPEEAAASTPVATKSTSNGDNQERTPPPSSPSGGSTSSSQTDERHGDIPSDTHPSVATATTQDSEADNNAGTPTSTWGDSTTEPAVTAKLSNTALPGDSDGSTAVPHSTSPLLLLLLLACAAAAAMVAA